MRISLAAARVNAEMTQTQAAEELNVSKTTIINWEKGRTSPDAKMVRRIEEVYGTPFDNIRDFKSEPQDTRAL